MKVKVLSLCVTVLTAWGCEMGSRAGKSPLAEVPFDVTVLSMGGGPVAGAIIEGGIDWEAFWVQTDDDGRARLPHYARAQQACIFRNDYFPLRVEGLAEEIYWLYRTPKSLRLIGDIEGWAIRFGADTLTTLEYQGDCHLYSYSDLGVAEIASAKLVSTVKETQLHGDKLWLTTHEDGVYVYSLEDPFSPRELFHLDISGYLGPFALKGDLIVVVGREEWDPLRVYSYSEDGRVELVAQFGSDYYVTKMAFLGTHLVVLGPQSLPTVYDLSEPAQPKLVYTSPEPDYWQGTLFGHFLLLTPREANDGKTIKYKLIDLADPSHPSAPGFSEADSSLIEIIDGSTAIGRYYSLYQAVSVLQGNIAGGFRTIAIITDDTVGYNEYHESEGNRSPYFIIGERLWKLEN